MQRECHPGESWPNAEREPVRLLALFVSCAIALCIAASAGGQPIGGHPRAVLISVGEDRAFDSIIDGATGKSLKAPDIEHCLLYVTIQATNNTDFPLSYRKKDIVITDRESHETFSPVGVVDGGKEKPILRTGRPIADTTPFESGKIEHMALLFIVRTNTFEYNLHFPEARDRPVSLGECFDNDKYGTKLPPCRGPNQKGACSG